jgi:putative transposase
MDQQAVRKTFKYKLQPTTQQEGTLAFVVCRCCELYNAALEERREAWRMSRVSITMAGQCAQLPAIKQERPEYQDLHSQVLQDVLTRLDRAFQAFFRRMKNGEKPGYPRYKSSTRSDSFASKHVGNGATPDNGFLVLAKLGRLAVRWSRPLEGVPKTVTIRREADGWYVTFSCAEVPIQPLPRTGQETGIDLGLESFATLADGSQIANPRIFRVAEMHLKRAQRRVSRRVKGSKRRRKAVTLLAQAHAGVRRARADFHHKTALALVRQYDTIYHEALQPANIIKNHTLAKSISYGGWSGFLRHPHRRGGGRDPWRGGLRDVAHIRRMGEEQRDPATGEQRFPTQRWARERTADVWPGSPRAARCWCATTSTPPASWVCSSSPAPSAGFAASRVCNPFVSICKECVVR